jgi:hypothetical protein
MKSFLLFPLKIIESISNSTLIYSLCKWVVANSTGLIAIPVALLAIIVSLYTGLFKENINDDRNFARMLKIKTYYELFEKQKHIDEDKIVSNINIKENNAQYTHILVIDRTGSTSNRVLDSKLDLLYNRIKNDFLPNIAIENIEKQNNSRKLSMKHLLVLRFYQELRNEAWDNNNFNNTKQIAIIHFDGERFSYPPPDKTYKNTKEYNFHTTTDKYMVRNLIETRINDELLLTGNHSSDFAAMFNEIQKLCNSKSGDSIILTVISDFCHDKQSENIEESLIENFKRNTSNISQYNLIYCPPTDPNDRTKSESLVNLLQKHIHGLDNIITIDLALYDNIYLENDLIDIFDKKILGCFSPININAQKIDFYYPKYNNSQGLITANAEIKIKNQGKDFSWRIATPTYQKNDNCNHVISYSINEKNANKRTFALNRHWHSLKANDSILFIDMRYDHAIETDEYRIEIIQDGKDFMAYPIQLREYMPKVVASYGNGLLNILCLFIILIIAAGTVLLCKNRNKYFGTTGNIICSVLLLLVIFISLLFIVWDFQYQYLSIASTSLYLIPSIAILYCIIRDFLCKKKKKSDSQNTDTDNLQKSQEAATVEATPPKGNETA